MNIENVELSFFLDYQRRLIDPGCVHLKVVIGDWGIPDSFHFAAI